MGNDKERESKLLKNTLILTIGTFLPKVVSLITLPLLTGYLTQAEYGSYDLITVMVSLLLPSTTLQIQTAAFRFLIDERGDQDEVRNTISTVFFFVLPVSILTLAVAMPLLKIDPAFKAVVAAYFLVEMLLAVVQQIARGLSRTREYSASAIITAAVWCVCVLVSIRVLGMGLLGVFASQVIANTIAFMYLSIRIGLYGNLSLSAISKDKLRKLLAYSWPMVPNGLSMWVMTLSDRFVIRGFMGLAWNGIYAVANKIPGLVHLAQTSFTLAWQENATIVSEDKDSGEYYSRTFRSLFDFTAGCTAILIAMTPLLFKILIRGNYDDAYAQIPILILAEFFFCLATYFGGIYVAHKKTRSVGITTVMAAVCNLVIDLIFIRFIGLYAASGSTLISYVALLIFRVIDIQKTVTVTVDLKHMIKILLVIIVQLFICANRSLPYYAANAVIGMIMFCGLNYRFAKMVLSMVRRKLMHSR